MTRHKHKQFFLEATPWHNSHESLLAQDASFRTYYRLKETSSGQSVVLMDAPPPYENIHSFVRIARFLKILGLRVPQILAEDQDLGFLVLEDFGDQTFTNMLNNGGDFKKLYMLATDILIHIHKNVLLKDLIHLKFDTYDLEKALSESKLFIEWYLPSILKYPLPQAALLEFECLFKNYFEKTSSFPQSLTLRDFHVDNLMIVPQNSESPLSGCGLLDFQDALMGPLVYDLVSLLEDARQYIAPSLSDDLKTHYKNSFSTPPWQDNIHFDNAYAFWAIQRNLKVLGIFTRLFLRDKKERYHTFIPRVLHLIEQDLTHPSLKDLRHWFDQYVPNPLRTLPQSFTPKHAMILAAGKGERLRPLTQFLPKPLLKIGGKALLDFALDRCEEENIRHITVNTHYRADQINAHFHQKPTPPYGLTLSHEPTLLETGGGRFKDATEFGTRPFLLSRQ